MTIIEVGDKVQFSAEAIVPGDLKECTFRVAEVGKVNARLTGKDAYGRNRKFLARLSMLQKVN